MIKSIFIMFIFILFANSIESTNISHKNDNFENRYIKRSECLKLETYIERKACVLKSLITSLPVINHEKSKLSDIERELIDHIKKK